MGIGIHANGDTRLVIIESRPDPATGGNDEVLFKVTPQRAEQLAHALFAASIAADHNQTIDWQVDDTERGSVA